MFFNTPNRCWIARLRSVGNCCHFGRTSLRMCWRCSGVSLFHTCARSCSSCRCADGNFCSRRLSSRTFCFSCELRLLKSRFGGGVYADGGRPARVRIRRPFRTGVLPPVSRSLRFLLLLSALLPLFLSLLLPWSLWLPLRRRALLLWRLIILAILRPIRVRPLRKAWRRQRRAYCQRHCPSRELEFPLHFPLHRLILVGLAAFFRLHRLRQIAQRRKIRNHIIILKHRHILVDFLNVRGAQRTLRRARTQPHHRQQQHRRRKRHPR